MKIEKKIIPASKNRIKAPYAMKAEFYVVHNTANNASANNEISYMTTNNRAISFHYAIDDIKVLQGIEENRNAFHAGDGANGRGNRKGIGIEICYSLSGGAKFDQAEINASKFIAQGLKEKGWGIDRVKKHQDFANKKCPHRTIDKGWARFLNMIKAEMAGGGAYVETTSDIVKVGDRGSRVTLLQTNLKGLGYDVGVIDGIFGANTESNLKDFQRNNGLAIDGIAGPDTFNKLDEIVKKLQKDLKVNVDGVIGKETQDAVNVIKRDYSDMELDGIARLNFLRLLKDSLTLPSEEEVEIEIVLQSGRFTDEAKARKESQRQKDAGVDNFLVFKK